MKTCANLQCGKQFKPNGNNQKVCSARCRYEAERIEHLTSNTGMSEEETGKSVRRCVDALKDGVNGKELRRRFGDHVYRRARAQLGPVGRRSCYWLGVPV